MMASNTNIINTKKSEQTHAEGIKNVSKDEINKLYGLD